MQAWIPASFSHADSLRDESSALCRADDWHPESPLPRLQTHLTDNLGRRGDSDWAQQKLMRHSDIRRLLPEIVKAASKTNDSVTETVRSVLSLY